MQFTKVHRELAKPVYEAIPKIAEKAGKKWWGWEPEWGDFCLYNKEIMIVIELSPHIKLSTQDPRMRTFVPTNPEKLIPFLHWEKLVGMLEEMGYTVKLRDKYNCGIYTDKLGVGRSAKDFQEAVQKAILALLEQLEEKQ